MSTRRWLVALPSALIALFAWSPFWVPTYETETVGNQGRLDTFIEATIGDPTKIDPIISSDSAAGEIESLVFEGLITMDEHQHWKGVLATRWETTEEALLAVMPGRRFPDGRVATAAEVARRVQAAAAAGRLGKLGAELRGADLLPAEQREKTLTLVEKDASGRPVPRDVHVRVDVPPRVRFHLSRVVPHFFDELQPLLGRELLSSDGVASRVTPEHPKDRKAVEERLAELLVVCEHNPILTFHLRHGVVFQDGVPFTAADVRFTWQAYMDPRNASPRTSSWEPIKDVEVVDDYTARVVYKRLYSPAIMTWAGGIVPKHLLDDEALKKEAKRRGLSGESLQSFGLRNSEFNEHPVGTGPFRFVEWRKDEFIHLSRNDRYWDRPPEFKEVYVRTIPEPVTQEMEFAAGAVDYYSAFPHQVERYKNDPRYQTISTVADAYTYIAYNLRKPMFQDLRVRKALGMAINVDDLIRYAFYGQGQRVSGPSYVNTPYYNWKTPLLPYDPAGAKRLLAEAGYTPGPDGILQKDGKRLAFKLITNNGNPMRKAVLTVAQDAWRKLGVDVRVQTFEWTVFLQDFVNTLQFDALVLGWAGGGMNPDKTQLWASSQTGPYQLNFSGYSNPKVDKLLEEIVVEYDLDKQAKLAREVHALIAADQPFTFLYAPVSTAVLDRHIVEMDEARKHYHRIEPVMGSIRFHFERWRKLATEPVFTGEG